MKNTNSLFYGSMMLVVAVCTIALAYNFVALADEYLKIAKI